MAAKENLAHQCHKVRKSLFCLVTSTRVWRRSTRRRWLPRRTSPTNVTRLENQFFLLGHEYKGLVVVHEEEVATSKTLPANFTRLESPFFRLGTSTRVWRQFTRMAAKENLARQSHQVRK